MTNRISVNVEHGFVVNKTHALIMKTVYKNSILMCNVTCKHYSKRLAYQCLLAFRRYTILSTCFVNSVRNTRRTLTEYDWSVYC